MIAKIVSFFRWIIVLVFRTPFLRKIQRSSPSLYSFLVRRLSIHRFSGMPLTLLFVAMASNLAMLLDTYGDILNSKEFVAIDSTVAKLLYNMRTDFMVRVFYALTQLGHLYVIVAGVMIMSAILIWKKKGYAILGLLVSVAGSALTVMLGKNIFKIGRPDEYSYYHMSSYSFPSGHATAAVSFYGMVFYLLIKNARRIKSKFALLTTGLVVILTIGFSRLYLGEHYLSDVVGGYLLGFLWLLLSMSIILWKEDKLRKVSGRRRSYRAKSKPGV